MYSKVASCPAVYVTRYAGVGKRCIGGGHKLQVYDMGFPGLSKKWGADPLLQQMKNWVMAGPG